jgi:hypothetical protein
MNVSFAQSIPQLHAVFEITNGRRHRPSIKHECPFLNGSTCFFNIALIPLEYNMTAEIVSMTKHSCF